MNKGESGMFNHRGFTLLEVLIAVSIFSIGLLAVASMQISAISGNRLGNELSLATFLAQEQVETLKSADFNSATLAIGNYADPNNPIDETGTNGGIFNRSWVVAANTTFSRSVTVTVNWPQGAPAHSVVLTTNTRGGGN
jgi:type IV pilus assembly protein PilV